MIVISLLPIDQPARRELRRRALTLAELLIVLVIMGILATVAVQSMAPMADQARFEATQRTLDNIRTAIVGPNSHANAGDAISGFVADMGRLPAKFPPDPPVLFDEPYRNELLENPEKNPTSTTFTNWKGPYIRLPIGTTELMDGWGNRLMGQPDINGAFVISRDHNSNPVWPKQFNEYDYNNRPLIEYRDWHADSITVTFEDIGGSGDSAARSVTLSSKHVLGIDDATQLVTGTYEFNASNTNPALLAIGRRVIKLTTPPEQTREIILRPGDQCVVKFYVK